MERFSVESCVGGYHVYKPRTPLVLTYLNKRYLAPFFGRASALFTSLFTSYITTRGTGTLRIKSTVNRAQVAKKEL